MPRVTGRSSSKADADDPRIKACRDWGYPVTVVGDAQLKSTLEAAGIRRAARLLRGDAGQRGEYRNRHASKAIGWQHPAVAMPRPG